MTYRRPQAALEQDQRQKADRDAAGEMGIVEGNTQRPFLAGEKSDGHKQYDEGNARPGREPAGEHARDKERSSDKHEAGSLVHS